MPLNYDNITIADSTNSSGRTFKDAYRCNYRITDQAGNTYVAFKQKGATLRNFPRGTQLKIGWKWNKSIYGQQEKVIQWFKILATPKAQTYKTPVGELPTADIDLKYRKLLQIMG
ncbi:MAG: hypothetical protein VKJ86_11175 [Synechococcus sp.]|nr:hypothetical protein [Synechococcus sp.]